MLRLLFALSMVALVTAGPALAQTTTDVDVDDNVFEPDAVSVNVGDRVRWTHVGNNPHTVTPIDEAEAEDAGFSDSHPNCGSPNFVQCMNSGDTYAVTFTKAGEYPYYCKIHGGVSGGDCSGMCGTVTVTGASTPKPTPRPTPAPAARPAPAPVATPAPTPTPSPSPSPTPEATAEPTPSPEPTEVAAAPIDDDGGGGSRVVFAVLAAVGVAGAGFGSWLLFFRR